MTTFHVKWAVTALYSGSDPDMGIHDGDREIVAEGEVDKAAESASALEAGLTSALEHSFPRKGMGGTYNIDRYYDIEITEVP